MWLQSLATELPITLADGTVWLSIGQGLLIGAVCLLFGVWVARLVGLLAADAPAGEMLGVGLASGLLVLTSWWAAVMSGGRSSFTPVAVGFVIAIGLAIGRRWRRAKVDDALHSSSNALGATDAVDAGSASRGSLVAIVVGGGVFVAVVALLYGSTIVLSPREGVQPLEFNDEAYYSVLGADLAETGTESLYSPAGFADLPGLPPQTWYHWGELWLASAVITVVGMSPLDARHFVVLPILLLAAGALTGTLVRRMTDTFSRSAFLWGFVACLFLAPVPLIQGPLLGALTVGMIFGITAYGVAIVAVLLALYSFTTLNGRPTSWSLSIFAGTAAAMILPAHVVIALLAFVGVSSVWAIGVARSLVTARKLPVVSTTWRRTLIATGIALLATVAGGVLTGHGLGDSGASTTVSPFNGFWRDAVGFTLLGSGALLSIAIAWFLTRRDSKESGLYLGAIVIVVVGALAWGALLATFTSTHFLVAGVGVFAMPAAAVAVWSIWNRLRATGHQRFAIALLVMCNVQMEFGIAMGIVRLQSFGPNGYQPVSEELLAEIRTLPADAKLAYACLPSEEVAFWDARLLSLDAHVGRRIVPMCFQAEAHLSLVGAPPSEEIPNSKFQWAPQHLLYPDASARPQATSVAAFLKANGIDYIYADDLHPNTLVPGAIPIGSSRETQVLRIP